MSHPYPHARRRFGLRIELLEDRTVPAVIPTDPGFPLLWGMNNTGQNGGTPDADIDAPEAWAVTTGSTSTIVAVIDTGVDYTHPDLYKNIWLNQGEIPAEMRPATLADGTPDPTRLQDTDGDGLITFYDLNTPANRALPFVTDLNGTGYIDAGDLLGSVAVHTAWENGVNDDGVGRTDDLIGWNYVTNTNDPLDDNSHGTHVSGTIGAVGDNGVGVTGVAWQVQIMAMKILDANGSGTLDEVVRDASAALRDSTDDGARVSNNSWVFSDPGSRRVPGETVQGTKYPELYAAIQYAGAHGHLVVAAAGNDGIDNDTSSLRRFPASYDLPNIISVAASDKNDRRASFSNYGHQTVDLAAPGGSGSMFAVANDNIWSTVPEALDPDGTPDGYASYRGTSMAAPHVTGTVALMVSARPDLPAARLKELLLATVDPLTDSSWLKVTKSKGRTTTTHVLASGGRLNAAQAVAAAVAEPLAVPSGGSTTLSGTTTTGTTGGSGGLVLAAGVAGEPGPAPADPSPAGGTDSGATTPADEPVAVAVSQWLVYLSVAGDDAAAVAVDQPADATSTDSADASAGAAGLPADEGDAGDSTEWVAAGGEESFADDWFSAIPV